jgi:hypothetical protein
MFFPFSSPIDLEELMGRRSQELRTSGRLKIRRCSRSWLYVARQSWVRGRLCDQLRLSHCFGSFNPCLD